MESVHNGMEDEIGNVEDAKSDEIQKAEIPELFTDEQEEPTADISEEVDYEELMREDILTLKSEFSELASINDITELDNPLRYAALRDLGLTPAEAYKATARTRRADTRSHLMSARGRSAASPVSMMSQSELAAARDLFPNKSDSELQRLYKRVTK